MSNQGNNRRHKGNQKTSKLRVNDEITAREVRILNAEGEPVGIFALEDALNKAQNEGLDLLEINPESSPPVCKIVDYGKYNFELQKRKKDANKRQKEAQKKQKVKELYIHLGIGEHDYMVRFRQLKSFLEEGMKVKIAVKLRGREMAHSAKGFELLNRFYEDIGKEEGAKLEMGPKLEGNNAVILFSALK